VSGFIYFIQVGDDGPVKIGWSMNPQKRLAGLQTAHPEQLHLRGYRRGSVQAERELHETLKDYRVNGEWFVSHEDVLAQIETEYEDVIDVVAGLEDAAKLLSIATNVALKGNDFEEAVRMLRIVAEDIDLALELLSPEVPA
jgi:hypothetical protein